MDLAFLEMFQMAISSDPFDDRVLSFGLSHKQYENWFVMFI